MRFILNFAIFSATLLIGTAEVDKFESRRDSRNNQKSNPMHVKWNESKLIIYERKKKQCFGLRRSFYTENSIKAQ